MDVRINRVGCQRELRIGLPGKNRRINQRKDDTRRHGYAHCLQNRHVGKQEQAKTATVVRLANSIEASVRGRMGVRGSGRSKNRRN
jgi:hypothetical protein